MVRSGMIKAIYDVLGSHAYLALEDFKVEEYQSSSNEPCISIVYRYNSNWQFRFHIPKTKTKLNDTSYERYWFYCTMLPGRESSEETLNADSRIGTRGRTSKYQSTFYNERQRHIFTSPHHFFHSSNLRSLLS